MNSHEKSLNGGEENTRFFDGFTKTMLTIMMCLLLAIFASGKYMSAHKMHGTGTADIVKDLGLTVTKDKHHTKF